MRQAAAELGISAEAVRQRVKRDTIPHERDAGTVYVILEADPTRPDTDPTTDRTNDRTELVEELRDRVAHLERELERRGVEAMRYQEIVAGLTRTNAELSARLPELTAGEDHGDTAEARESPESADPTRTPTDTPGEPEAPAQRVPWWRRMFGG